MPQRRATRPPDPQVVAARMTELVREGLPDTRSHLSVTAQIQRLGVPAVLGLTDSLGEPRSDRTVRRWRQENRIPDERIATVVARADQVGRRGGVEAAADAFGVAAAAVTSWLADPDEELDEPAQQQVETHDRVERRTAAGLAVKQDGRLARRPRLFVEGDVWVKGDTDSDTYRAHRRVGFGDAVLLNDETAEAVLDACDRGDSAAALRAIEAYLSEYHAGCAGYGDDLGWHFEDLDAFRLEW